MRTANRGRILVGVMASVLTVAGAGRADTDGLVFRANGIYRGEADISEEGIKCEIPAVGSAIPDGSFNMGLWNTYGVKTLMFPDVNSPFGDPCGGYIQLQNNMTAQGINVQQVQIKMRIADAKRLAGYVPTRRGWPLACRKLRRLKVFAGTRLDPVGSSNQPSSSAQANVAFVQLLPILSTQLISCLRDQYAPLPTEVYSSLRVVVSARAFGVADNGQGFNTNSVNYTLTLRHTCGNGRLDDGEICDATSPSNQCLLGECAEGFCGATPVPCVTNADCIGGCLEQGGPSECTCQFGGSAN